MLQRYNKKWQHAHFFYLFCPKVLTFLHPFHRKTTTLASPKLLTLGKAQINLALHSFIRNFVKKDEVYYISA